MSKPQDKRILPVLDALSTLGGDRIVATVLIEHANNAKSVLTYARDVCGDETYTVESQGKHSTQIFQEAGKRTAPSKDWISARIH